MKTIGLAGRSVVSLKTRRPRDRRAIAKDRTHPRIHILIGHIICERVDEAFRNPQNSFRFRRWSALSATNKKKAESHFHERLL